MGGWTSLRCQVGDSCYRHPFDMLSVLHKYTIGPDAARDNTYRDQSLLDQDTLLYFSKPAIERPLNYTVWGGNLSKRFCNIFSESSHCLLGYHGSYSTAQRPVELSENILQNLFNMLPPQTVDFLEKVDLYPNPARVPSAGTRSSTRRRGRWRATSPSAAAGAAACRRQILSRRSCTGDVK